MLWYEEYRGHMPQTIGKRKVFDNNIYTFDIETTSYIVLDGIVYPAIKYKDLTVEERNRCTLGSCMYIWQMSINETVYYGRYWYQLEEFLDMIEMRVPERKIIFIHNASFEFQYLKSEFKFKDVMARNVHKVMKAFFVDYNFEIRCSYLMSNSSLAQLPRLFNLPVEKKISDLDYTKLRTSDTPLTDTELGYCECDCLVVYEYIKYELQTYPNVDKIPLTSTGHVRRELKELVAHDENYKRKVRKSINTNPHIFNLLQLAFMGGYTHSNWIYTDEILYDVDSVDETSEYPYVLVTHKFPATEFKECHIKSVYDMSKRYAYLVRVRFDNISCQYYNNFISASKCQNLVNGVFDNGRIIKADSLEMVLTDVDFRFICDTHTYKEYEIIESYYSRYEYLPTQFINFVLDKYVKKTQWKGIVEKEVEYAKEKNKFNALYGMAVTNTIRNAVMYEDEFGWSEKELTNEEIIEKLNDEKDTAFLNFATGVWVTAYARNNLLRNVIKLDEYCAYCDTDSMKLLKGYDKTVIDDYNKFVENKIRKVSEVLDIPFERFAPKDIKGKARLLGIFDDDGHYEEFITQGAKKYAYRQNGELHITVAGVPKAGVKALNNDLNNFVDDLVFNFEDTNKMLLSYCEHQPPVEITDYKGITSIVDDESGCCLVPTTYVLGKALDYAKLLTSNSSKRARYKE